MLAQLLDLAHQVSRQALELQFVADLGVERQFAGFAGVTSSLDIQLLQQDVLQLRVEPWPADDDLAKGLADLDARRISCRESTGNDSTNP